MEQAAHTKTWETAETILFTALFLGLLLGFLLPLPLSRWFPRAASIVIGIALLALSILLIGRTRRQFRETRQPTEPGQPTTKLMTSGIFSWSRNPLYLAGVMLYLGLALLFNSLWLVLLTVPAVVAFHVILIYPEERYLEAKFGEAYWQYKRSVRRWWGQW